MGRRRRRRSCRGKLGTEIISRSAACRRVRDERTTWFFMFTSFCDAQQLLLIAATFIAHNVAQLLLPQNGLLLITLNCIQLRLQHAVSAYLNATRY